MQFWDLGQIFFAVFLLFSFLLRHLAKRVLPSRRQIA